VVIKAISVSVAADLAAAQDYQTHVDYVLFDTRCAGYGGSGEQFDWNILSHYRGNTPFLLSGGIAPESAEALLDFKHTSFAGIDLNSRFEIAPALKDIAVLDSFIQKFKTSIQ
jgi:phosphoribosylanthranilate isomerase